MLLPSANLIWSLLAGTALAPFRAHKTRVRAVWTATLALILLGTLVLSLLSFHISVNTPNLHSKLQKRWYALHASPEAEQTRLLFRVESGLSCCGFRRITDHPIPPVPKTACFEKHGWTEPCGPKLEDEMRAVGFQVGSWGVFAVVVQVLFEGDSSPSP